MSDNMSSSSTSHIKPLTDGRYDGWRVQMTAAIQGKSGWWEHLSGAHPRPHMQRTFNLLSDVEQKAITTWDATDIKVRGFIVERLDESQHHHIDGWDSENWTALRVWDTVRDAHRRAGAFTLVDAMRGLTTPYTDGASMKEHLAKFRAEASRLTNMGHGLPQPALCGFLLTTLPSSWKAFVQSRPRVSTLPEIQPDGSTKMVPAPGWTVGDLCFDLQAEANRLGNDAAAMLARSPPTSSPTPRVPCMHCGKTNHPAAKCWQKYPEQKKEYDDKRRGRANVAQASQSSPSSHHPPSRDDGLYFCVRNAVSSSALAASSTTDTVSYRPSDGVKGMFVDSGASYHYVPHREWLTDFVPVKDHYVSLADSSRHPVLGIGTLRAIVNVPGKGKVVRTFSPVHCVPRLDTCLLSVKVLTESDRGLTAVFYGDNCNITEWAGTDQNGNPILGTVVAHARKSVTNGGLWRLDVEPQPLVANTAPVALVAAQRDGADSYSAPPLGDFHLWHGRLGHFNSRSVVQLFEKGMTDSPDAKRIAARIRSDLRRNQPHCSACEIGKSHRAPFTSVASVVTQAPLQLVYMDICGPLPVAARNGTSYFLVIVDDWTHYLWARSMREKSQAFALFQQFHAWAVAAHSVRGLLLNRVRSDGGGEFDSNAFRAYAKQHGIEHEYTAPASSQQNGAAERAIRVLMDGGRTLLEASGLPPSFWAHCVGATAYLRNILPSSRSGNTTPYERWTGRKPTIGHLRVFGCLAYAHVPERDRNKLSARARRCVFIGYADDSRQWRLYDPSSRTVFDSRDVRFIEHVRGYGSVGEGGELLSPSPSHSIDDSEADGPAGDSVAPSPAAVSHDGPVAVISEEPAPPARLPSELSRLTDYLQSSARDPAPSTVRNANAPQTGTRPRTRSMVNLAMLVQSWSEPVEAEIAPPAHELLSAVAVHDSLALAAIDATGDEPASYTRAVQAPDGPQWRAAGQAEYDSLTKTGTFELVPRPAHRKVIGCKAVCKIKRGADGQIVKYKVRFVARGFAQTHGVDYNETFAPVVRYSSLRLLFSLCAQHDWELHQMDVKSAYLNGDLEEEIYMEQPEGFTVPGKEDHVCLLKKSLYGLKQAGRTWHHKIDLVFKREGFASLSAETCMYIRRDSDRTIIIALYVDDILLASSTLPALTALKSKLASTFEMEDLGEATFVLGMEIKRDRAARTFSINQSAYVHSVLVHHGMENCSPISDPMDSRARTVLAASTTPCVEGRRLQYQSLIGSLMFAAICTRPDIAYAVTTLSKFASNPAPEHELAAKRVLRYLKGTTQLGLCYKGTGDHAQAPELLGFCDSDWGSNPNDRRSITGYVFTVAGGAVSWQSKRQGSVALSSVEAEYMAARAAVQEAIWWRSILRDLGYKTDAPTRLLSDSMGSIAIANGSDQSTRTKHIDIQYHFTRECVEDRQVALVYVPTEMMAADTLTKPLAAAAHQRSREQLGMCVV